MLTSEEKDLMVNIINQQLKLNSLITKLVKLLTKYR